MKIVICGKNYDVEFTKAVNGGEFYCGRQKIYVDSKVSLDNQMNILLHEVMEIILTEKDYRFQLSYKQTDNSDYLFVFNHRQFDDVVKEVSYVVRQLFAKDGNRGDKKRRDKSLRLGS